MTKHLQKPLIAIVAALMVALMAVAIIGVVSGASPALANTNMTHNVCGSTTCTHNGHEAVTFASLNQTMITAVVDGGGTIPEGNYQLIENVAVGGYLSVASGKTVSLCLGGFTMDFGTFNISVSSGATLNVCDCAATQGTVTSTFEYVNIPYNAGTIKNDGTLNVFGGNIINTASMSSQAIYNQGVASVYGGSVSAQYWTINNNASSGAKPQLNVHGGTIKTTGTTIICNAGDVVVTGGTLISTNKNAVGITVGQGNTLEMSGGTISGVATGVENRGGTATISGTAEITASSSAMYNNMGTIYVAGGTISSTGSSSNSIGIENFANSTAYISGGNVIGVIAISNKSRGIVSVSGTANIFTDDDASDSLTKLCIKNSGTLEITGGTISNTEGEVIGISSGGVANISGGTLINTNANNTDEVIVVAADCTANISGGTISHAGGFAINLNSSTAELYLSGAPTISYPSEKAAIYLKEGTVYATNEEQSQKYTGQALSIKVSSAENDVVVVNNIDNDTASKFTSANNGYILAKGDGTLYMHKHTWASTWSTSATEHWKECTTANCPITAIADKYRYENHTSPISDNNCTTPDKCGYCGYELVEAQSTHDYTDNCDEDCNRTGCAGTRTAPHTPNEDDNNCTTSIVCADCNAETTAAQEHAYDNTCDTTCNNTGCTHAREITHTPNADDNDCSTAVVCSVCGATTTPAKPHAYTAEKDATDHWNKCSVCGTEEAKIAHTYTSGVCNCGAKQKYTVSVVGGKVGDDVSAVVEKDGNVTVVANAAAAGKQFSGWSVNGEIVSNATSYTFAPNANITIEAVYTDIAPASGDGLGGGAIAGIVIGSIAFVAIVVASVLLIIKKKKVKK